MIFLALDLQDALIYSTIEFFRYTSTTVLFPLLIFINRRYPSCISNTMLEMIIKLCGCYGMVDSYKLATRISTSNKVTNRFWISVLKATPLQIYQDNLRQYDSGSVNLLM